MHRSTSGEVYGKTFKFSQLQTENLHVRIKMEEIGPFQKVAILLGYFYLKKFRHQP